MPTHPCPPSAAFPGRADLPINLDPAGFIQAYLPMIHAVRRKISRKIPEHARASLYDDLMQAGYIGLIKARDTFSGKGEFTGYACFRMRGEMIQVVRNGRRNPRGVWRNVILDSNETVDNLLDTFDPAAFCEKQEAITRLISAIENLPESDRALIMAYHSEGRTLQAIANEYGCTESNISIILKRIRKTLQKQIGLN